MTPALAEQVATFRPVTWSNEALLARHAAGFYAHRSLPRYFTSPSCLASQPSVFSTGTVDGCLVVLKRRQFMGRATMLLVVPPAHPDGDTAQERQVIEWFRAQGVGAKLSAEDVALYGYAPGDVPPSRGQAEYVYEAATHAAPTGRRGGNTRHARNDLAARLTSGQLRLSTTAAPDALVDLARRWHAQTGRHRLEGRPVRRWANATLRSRHVRRHGTILWLGQQVVAASLTERVGPRQVVILSRIHDRVLCPLPDTALALHQADSAYWHAVRPDTLLTIGGDLGVPGLAAHKRKLRPVSVPTVGTLPPTRRLTTEDYRAAVPGTDQAQLTLDGML